MGRAFERIKDWLSQDLICARCGKKQSVKYRKNGENYCNGCIGHVI